MYSGKGKKRERRRSTETLLGFNGAVFEMQFIEAMVK